MPACFANAKSGNNQTTDNARNKALKMTDDVRTTETMVWFLFSLVIYFVRYVAKNVWMLRKKEGINQFI